jgi:hypothetical protein
LAERGDLEEKERWYAKRCDLLRAALLERVEPENASEPGQSSPGGNLPGTPPSPNPGKTDIYEELLAKVEWDRGIADRLIEYERKKAPAADRNELLRRAILRLKRDSR